MKLDRGHSPKQQKVVSRLIRTKMQIKENQLYKDALMLEKCKKLNKEIKEWDKNLSGDGLEDI